MHWLEVAPVANKTTSSSSYFDAWVCFCLKRETETLYIFKLVVGSKAHLKNGRLFFENYFHCFVDCDLFLIFGSVLIHLWWLLPSKECTVYENQGESCFFFSFLPNFDDYCLLNWKMKQGKDYWSDVKYNKHIPISSDPFVCNQKAKSMIRKFSHQIGKQLLRGDLVGYYHSPWSKWMQIRTLFFPWKNLPMDIRKQ